MKKTAKSRRIPSNVDDLILLTIAKHNLLSIKELYFFINYLPLKKGIQISGFYEHVRKLKSKGLIDTFKYKQKRIKYYLTQPGIELADELKSYYLRFI